MAWRREEEHRLKGKEAPLVSHAGGEVGFAPWEDCALQVAGGTDERKAGAGRLAPPTRTTTREGLSGMRSVDSVCPQTAFSRSGSASGQGGPQTKDQGQAGMGVDIPIPTIPMDFCYCPLGYPSQLFSLSQVQVSVAPLDYSISVLRGPPLSGLKQGVSFLNRKPGSPFYNPWASTPCPTCGVPFSLDFLHHLPHLSSTQSCFVTVHSVFPLTRTTGFLETNHFFLCPGIGWKHLEDPAVWESPSLHLAFGGPLIGPFQALLPHQCIQLLCKAHQGAEGLQ